MNRKKYIDPRIRRSKESLKKALLYFVNQKPYEEISISEIVEYSGLARPTFYLHYSSKDELLIDCFRDASIAQLKKSSYLKQKETLDSWLDHANQTWFSQWDKQSRLIRIIFEARLDQLLVDTIYQSVYPLLKEAVGSYPVNTDESLLRQYAYFYAGGFVQLIYIWLFDSNESKSGKIPDLVNFLTDHFVEKMILPKMPKSEACKAD